MTRADYRAILGRLPIKNPTAEDMAMLCPHLTRAQAVAAFGRVSRCNFVACPPLRIDGAFQLVSFVPRFKQPYDVVRGKDGKVKAVVPGTKIHPPSLNWTYTGRTRASYTDGKDHGDVFHSFQHVEEAIEFARLHWGSELILDTWQDVVELCVDDPADLNENGGPKTKEVLYIGLNRRFSDIVDDGSKPQSVLIDEAISEMALDKAEQYEIQGGRGAYTTYNCAYCGHGLNIEDCNGCGRRFKDEFGRGGSNTPLSPKMVKFLRENGHVFKKDPEIAWKAEAEQHKLVRRRQDAALVN